MPNVAPFKPPADAYDEKFAFYKSVRNTSRLPPRTDRKSREAAAKLAQVEGSNVVEAHSGED